MNERAVLVSKMKGIASRVDALNAQYKGSDMPLEASNEIAQLWGDFDELRLQVDNFDRGQSGKNFLEASQGTSAQHHGWRNSSEVEGNVPVDPKAWREMDVKVGRQSSITIRYNVPLAVQAKDYPEAFMEYLRKGLDHVRPEGRKVLIEGIDSAGGFTVPEDYQARLIRKIATMAVVRSHARVVQTSRDSIKWPKLKYTADDNFTSGVRMTWTGETPATSTIHRVTDPVFSLVDIPVHTAMASLPIGLDLLEDSAFDLEGLATDLIGEAFALGEEEAFWTGSGSGQPLGMITNVDTPDGIQSVPSGGASTLTGDGLIELAYALPAQYEIGARMFWRKQTEKAVRLLKYAVGDHYVWPVEERVGGFGTVEPTILGYPISRAEFVPAIEADAFPIIFGQMTGYYVVDRVGISFKRLDQPYAESNILVILARKRVGGQVVEPWRLRAQKVETA